MLNGSLKWGYFYAIDAFHVLNKNLSHVFGLRSSAAATNVERDEMTMTVARGSEAAAAACWWVVC